MRKACLRPLFVGSAANDPTSAPSKYALQPARVLGSWFQGSWSRMQGFVVVEDGSDDPAREPCNCAWSLFGGRV